MIGIHRGEIDSITWVDLNRKPRPLMPHRSDAAEVSAASRIQPGRRLGDTLGVTGGQRVPSSSARSWRPLMAYGSDVPQREVGSRKGAAVTLKANGQPRLIDQRSGDRCAGVVVVADPQLRAKRRDNRHTAN